MLKSSLDAERGNVHPQSLDRPIATGLRSLLLALAALLSPLAAGADGETAAVPAVDGKIATSGIAAEEEVVIRDLYQLIEHYAHGSELALSFELDGFRTYRRSELADLDYLSVVTMPVGELIELDRAQYNGPDGESVVSYVPAWRDVGYGYSIGAEGRQLAGLTVAGVLGKLAEQKPEYAHVAGLTAYQVEVSLGDSQRRYDAALLWRYDPATKEVSIRILDNITPRLNDVVGESAPRMGPKDDYLATQKRYAKENGMLGRPTKDDATPCCEPSDQTRQLGATAFYGNAHFFGGMTVAGGVDYRCKCEEDCSQSCDPNNGISCYDSGFTQDTCHYVRADFQADVGFAETGRAECHAAYACAATPCLFCLCDFNVRLVKTNPLGSSYTLLITPSSAPVVHRYEKNFPIRCPLCRPGGPSHR